MACYHLPVLLRETIEGLAVKPDGVYVDGTAGGGGHSEAIAKRLSTGRLIAIDQDPDAIAAVTKRLADYPGLLFAGRISLRWRRLSEASALTAWTAC